MNPFNRGVSAEHNFRRITVQDQTTNKLEGIIPAPLRIPIHMHNEPDFKRSDADSNG